MAKVNDMPAHHEVLVLGANDLMIHGRLVQAGRISVDPNERMITCITGQSHTMPRFI